jgi:Domain of unknown function (DUF4429)/Short C-terminal domain
MTQVLEAKGQNGTVIFDGNMVVLRRTGFVARSTVGKGEKQIPIANITAIQYKAATVLFRGYIQFTLAGGVEARSRVGKAVSDAMQDENSVVFLSARNPDFERIRDAIQQTMAARSAGAAPQFGPVDVPARLQQLAGMLEQGLITEAEYQTKRAELLGRL